MFGWLWVETRMFRTRRLNHVPHYIMAILVSQDKIFHNFLLRFLKNTKNAGKTGAFDLYFSLRKL